MPQRVHKKSRNGCLVCKRRHLKCDERQPICSNCATAERACEYGSRSLRPGPVTAPRSLFPGAEAHLTPIPVLGVAPPESSSVNMLHFELYHNLYTKIRATFDPNRSFTWLADDIDPSILTPYLVNELLAFSALHLSTTCPDRRDYYRYHATQLQTHALSIFKESSPQVTQETCLPLFVFATGLGIHMLCDTLIYREGPLTTFLDRFVHFFRVYHGVRTIVNKSRHLIEHTPLGPSFNIGVDLYRFNGFLGPGCKRLLDLIYSANLGYEPTQLYKQAVESLQCCLNVIEDRGRDELHVGVNAVTTWPIMVEIEFTEFLEQRRPEALVILAHYAALWYRFRGFWLFGDAGEFVIREVKGYLGAEWEEWLAWPSEVLQS